MSRMMSVAAAVVLAIGLAGCAATGTGAAKPCESCKWGIQDAAAKESRTKAIWYCAVDGKKVDCSKQPMECSECAKK